MTVRPRRRRGFDRLTSADRLEDENDVTAGHLVGPVDELARAMALKWGEDRLHALVAPDLAERFGRQREKFERAVHARPIDLDALRTEAARMANAWRFLDAEAERLGAPTLVPEAWEIEVDGQPAAILRDGRAVPAYLAQQPGRRVYTLDEVARILALDAMAVVNATKDFFPGAVVAAVRPARTRLAEQLDDEIPF